MSLLSLIAKTKEQKKLSQEELQLIKEELHIFCITEIADNEIKPEEEDIIFSIIDKITFNQTDKTELINYYDETIKEYKNIRNSSEDGFYEHIKHLTNTNTFNKEMLKNTISTVKQIAISDNDYHIDEKCIISLWNEYIREA